MQVSKLEAVASRHGARAGAAVFAALGLLAAGCGSSDAPSAGQAGAAAVAGSTSGTSGAASVGTAGAGPSAGSAGTTAVGSAGMDGESGSGGAPSAGGTVGTSGASGSNAGSAGVAGSGGSAGSGVVATEKFSFFVTSWVGLQRLAKNFGLGDGTEGFGGDLRYGETGPGAGLRGADKICATLAEASMPGAGAKGWRAFLSAADDGTGKQVNAIDRVGTGPWYDRLGRLFGNNVADINAQRPTSADSVIKNDFPNEDGVPNHQPDTTQPAVDNHDMLTGSNSTGKLMAATATCLDWTSAIGDTVKEGKPRVGHSWPRGSGDSANWMSSLTESGCKAGANLKEQGGPMKDAVTVGSGGGYGGIYCFALKP